MSGFDRAGALASTSRHLAPHRLEMFRRFGVELVMGERSGYRFRNLGSDWIYDVHLNGGTFNLGHRNGEVREALVTALDEFDVGNHHFASTMRAQLAEELLATQDFGAEFVSFSSSGSEAVDVAIKAARWATKRRPVVSIDQGYHGRSGLSGAVGDDSAARYFFSDYPAECIKVGWNDGAAIEQAVSIHQPCAVIIETIPATYGFPPPDPGYLEHVRAVCTRNNVLMIADEVQTGLGRSGSMWAIEHFGVVPDMLITSKGLGGGLYPFAATLMTEKTGQWLRENGWAFVSTFGGSEVGCAVASKVLEITQRPNTTANVQMVATVMAEGLAAIQKDNDYLVEVRQTGLIIGLKFDHPEGALHVMKALLDRGVWAIFAGFDLSVLQFKPGLLLTSAECADIIDRTEQAVRASALSRTSKPAGFGLPSA